VNKKLTHYCYFWIVFLVFLAACGTVPAQQAASTTTIVDVTAVFEQAAGTAIVQITQTAFATPTLSPTPTGTPWPTQTPLPVYALNGQLKAYTIDGNLYVQNSNGQNVQLTHSKADRDPIFSDDSKKIVFYRWMDNSFYSIEIDGSNQQKIFNISSLAVQDHAEIKALTFIKSTHILLFNIYICGERPGLYAAANCFVSTYSVDADSGKTEEIGQRVSGIGFDESNFVLSPNQKYLSIAGSGHINIFSFSAGHFKLAYFGAFTYSMTRGYEFLPYQYWLPDSSGLIIVSAAAGTSNSPPDTPNFYDIFRYTIGKKAVQIQFDAYPMLGSLWRMGCTVSVSPDRNWIFFVGNKAGSTQGDELAYLGNLNDRSTRIYESLGYMPCSNIVWGPDSKHFGVAGLAKGFIGSVDGSPLVLLDGSFDDWVDATHYRYSVSVDAKTYKSYTAEIGGESIHSPTPTVEP
jgi:Tol biopolymer transport system component